MMQFYNPARLWRIFYKQKMKPATSIFDEFVRTQDPAAAFVWEEIKEKLPLNKSDIVCEGELQELDILSNALTPVAYYIATRTTLYQCSVHSLIR